MRNHGFKETTISLNVVLSSYGLPTQPARKSTILALVELAVNEYYYNKSTGITISKLVAFPAFPTKIATHHKGFVGGMLHLEDCRSKKQAEEDEARQIIPIHLAGGASHPPLRPHHGCARAGEQL